MVEVENLQSKEGILQSLDEIINRTINFNEIVNSGRVRFVFKDKKDRFLNEQLFFKYAVEVGADKIATIIEKFVASENPEDLYWDEETTAFGFAALELGLYDKKYIDTVLKYLSVIDMEHDVFNRGELIPAV